MLFYGAECWTPLKKHARKLNSFHNRCVRTILGISNRQQWSECITMAEVRRRWGDEETAAEKVGKIRLAWLGHVARMPDHRIPKALLFSWLPQDHPRCGPRRRWTNVKDIAVEESEWYREARRSRAGWREMCRQGMENHGEVEVMNKLPDSQGCSV